MARVRAEAARKTPARASGSGEAVRWCGRGPRRMMSRVMMIFWNVRKRFSPYVVNGNACLTEYARLIPYASVSSA